MKKSVVLAGVFLALLIIPACVSAVPFDDFQKQVQRAAFYAENYETGNANYNFAKLKVYLFTVEEEMNALLHVTGDVALTKPQLESVLGSSETVSWAVREGSTDEVELAEPLAVWLGKTLFDGENLQLKIDVAPYVREDQTILYKAKITTVFKEPVTLINLQERLNTIETTAKTYALDTTDLEVANTLAESSVNFEALAQKFLEQSDDKKQSVVDLFGEEHLVKEQKIVVKDYELFNNDKRVKASLHVCDDCTGVNGEVLYAQLAMYNNKGQEITYYVDTDVIGQQGYDTLGINGLKSALIDKNREINEYLDKELFPDAYQAMAEFEIVSKLLNQKINEGSKQTSTEEFLDAIQFYAGLFEGYPLVGNSFYNEQIFEKTLYVQTQTTTEICTNQIDDNDNEKIDCQDALCTGQVCGTTQSTQTVNGQEITTDVPLYCIAGQCTIPEDLTQKEAAVCGNNVCEEDEETSCIADCFSSCTTYPPLDCDGKVIFKGVDQNGCPLAPICVANTLSCTKDTDCSQPLCGAAVCTITQGQTTGTCEVENIEQCSQPKCVDGETKTCSEGSFEIVTDICELGVWKKTGERCTVEEFLVKEIKKENVCTLASDCKQGEVCSAGTCKFIPKTQKKALEETSELDTKGVSFLTGQVVDIGLTGKNVITGELGVTGIARSEEFVGEMPDTSTFTLTPETPAASSGFSSHFTGTVRTLDGKQIEIEASIQDSLQQKTAFAEPLETGVTQIYKVRGSYKVSKNTEDVSIVFVSGGEDFNTLTTLLSRYRAQGAEWKSWKLQETRTELQELARTFNNDFAYWYFNEFLPSTQDLSTKKDALYALYDEHVEKTKELAALMDDLKLRTLEYTPQDIISVNYEREGLGKIEASESIADVRFLGMDAAVQVPVLSLDATVFYPETFVKESYKTALTGNRFASQDKERSYNFGLTDGERERIRQNERLQKQIQTLVDTTRDGTYDIEITFYEGDNTENDAVYNLFVSLADPSESNAIKVYPLQGEAVPNGLDSRIKVSFDALWQLFKSREEASWRYTLYPSWDTSFRPKEKIDLVIDWINTQTKLNRVKNSLEVTPKGENLDDFFMELLYTLGEPEKPESASS